MLPLPNEGMAKSVRQHNIDARILSEWIEASIRFSNSNVSKSDFIDVLVESNVYAEAGFAEEIVNDCIQHQKRKYEPLGALWGIEWVANSARVVNSWKEHPIPTYLNLLALSRGYSWWHDRLPAAYGRQGELFEAVAEFLIRGILPNWEICVVGWSQHSTDGAAVIAARLADCLYTTTNPTMIADLNALDAKDRGLDVVAYRTFRDERTGSPVILVQCASGKNWMSKLHTPDVDMWGAVLSQPTNPIRGFCCPHDLSEDDFKRASRGVKGLVLDRSRLLTGMLQAGGQVSDELRSNICSWIDDRLPIIMNAE